MDGLRAPHRPQFVRQDIVKTAEGASLGETAARHVPAHLVPAGKCVRPWRMDVPATLVGMQVTVLRGLPVVIVAYVHQV